MKNFKFLALSAILFLAVSATTQAQTKNLRDMVAISFTPNHSNWQYDLNDTVEINLSVRQFNVNLPETSVIYSWGMEMSPAEEEKIVSTGKSGIVTLRLKGSPVPGFKTISAKAIVDGTTYTNYLTVGFSPDLIKPTVPMPKDFTAFWDSCLTAARRTPLEPLFTLQPSLCTPYSDVYMVRYQVNKPMSYFYGMMRVPKGVNPYCTSDKRYPAILEVPGAGVRSYKGASDEYAKAGIITLQIGIHGVPVNMPDQVYLDLRYAALANYNTMGLDNRNTYYYQRVYVGCVRAVDLLCSLSYIDINRLAVRGSSQGGGLSLVVSGLCPEIDYACVVYPALCELAGSQRGRIDGWPQLFTHGMNTTARDQKIQVASYYDAVNFARLVRVPVLFIQGYNDRVCPPTTTMAAYNVLAGKKELILPLDCAHWLYNETKEEHSQWLIDRLTK